MPVNEVSDGMVKNIILSGIDVVNTVVRKPFVGAQQNLSCRSSLVSAGPATLQRG